MKAILNSADGTVEIGLSENLLQTNEAVAAENRKEFDRRGIFVVDILGSVGAGKTTLVQQMVLSLKNRKRVASIAGDLATTIDADRIRSAGAEVIQVNTGSLCHLDANLVRSVLPRLTLDGLDVLLIENVGNLICPGEFPLGAHKRLVVVSFTEGPYMVKKHPAIFLDADVLAVNKADLARIMGVDGEALAADARAVKPGLPVVFTNARDGMGVEALLEALGLGAS